jgi:segregation and condensation protein B
MELKSLIEAILFAAHEPLSLKEIRTMVAKPDETADPALADPYRKIKEGAITAAIEELKVDYTQQGRSFQIQEVAGAFQLVSQAQFAPWLKSLVGEDRPHRLSQASLETLAIIAYRQPITRAEIEKVRGVNVDGVMQTLLERGLVSITGRAEIVGRPMLYGTTRQFMEHFGLKDLNELPAVEELRRVELPKPDIKETEADEKAEEPAASTPAAP